MCGFNRGSHTFSEEQKFFRNAKFGRERRSQWAGVVHEEGVTPLFDVCSIENGNQRMSYILEPHDGRLRSEDDSEVKNDDEICVGG